MALCSASRTGSAQDRPADVRAHMACEHAVEPGRVRCSAEVHAEAGKELSFADVAIVSLPPFAMALKGRLGRDDTTSQDARNVTWAFGLVAKRTGQGDVAAKVRVVICDKPGPEAPPTRCVPVTLDVHATVLVGA